MDDEPLPASVGPHVSELVNTIWDHSFMFDANHTESRVDRVSLSTVLDDRPEAAAMHLLNVRSEIFKITAKFNSIFSYQFTIYKESL